MKKRVKGKILAWVLFCVMTLCTCVVPAAVATAEEMPQAAIEEVIEVAAEEENAEMDVAEPEQVQEVNVWKRAEGETFYDYFERVWLDKLAGYVCVLLGAVSAVAVTVAKVKKAHSILVASGEKLGKSQEDLALTQRDLAQTREVFVQETAAVKEALGDVLRAQETLNETYQQAFDTLENIRKAVLVGFCNDGELVRTGYAKEVARLLGVSDEEGQ